MKIEIKMSADGRRAELTQGDATFAVTGRADVVEALARACRRVDVIAALEEEMGRRGAAREPFVPDGPFPTEAKR